MIERLRVRTPTEAAEEFSTPELTFCADFYSVHSVRSVPPHVPQWHVKDPGHSAKSACGRLQLNTHTPWFQRSRNGLTILSTHSVGTCEENAITTNIPLHYQVQLQQRKPTMPPCYQTNHHHTAPTAPGVYIYISGKSTKTPVSRPDNSRNN